MLCQYCVTYVSGQIFSCPSAELLREVAGDAPGALGASAHGAVAGKMCTHVGGYTELLALVKLSLD